MYSTSHKGTKQASIIITECWLPPCFPPPTHWQANPTKSKQEEGKKRKTTAQAYNNG